MEVEQKFREGSAAFGGRCCHLYRLKEIRFGQLSTVNKLSILAELRLDKNLFSFFLNHQTFKPFPAANASNDREVF